MLLKQSTARNRMILMVLTSDHITGAAGLTLTITLSRDGGAFTSITPTVTDRGSGFYNLALTATHTDTLGDLALHITGGGTADPTDVVDQVVAFDPGDAVRLGLSALSALPSAAAGAAGGLVINGANTGTLTLAGSLAVTNSAGNAVTLTSSGGGGSGLALVGQGASPGLAMTGGASAPGFTTTAGGSGQNGATFSGSTTGHGVQFIAGSSGGNGIRTQAAGASGFFSQSTGSNGSGMELLGNGTGDGFKSTGGANGHGMDLIGGTTTGDGFRATTTGGLEFNADITGMITGTISGNLTGSIGSIGSNGLSATSIAPDAITATGIASSAANEIRDAIWAQVMVELSGGPPATTGTTLSALEWMFALARNRITQSATTQTLFKDDTVTVLATAAVSDSGSTFTRNEWGP